MVLSSACGYIWYYAYYIPADRQYKTQYERQESFWKLADPDGLFDVIVLFQRTPERGNRDCFAGQILVNELGPDGQPLVDTASSMRLREVPSTESVTISCESSGLREVLRVQPDKRGNTWTWFKSERICLSRKHKRISIEFEVSLSNEQGEVITSDLFHIEAVRWEARNWLGQE
jgi:hypothetical protein